MFALLQLGLSCVVVGEGDHWVVVYIFSNDRTVRARLCVVSQTRGMALSGMLLDYFWRMCGQWVVFRVDLVVSSSWAR